METSVYRITNDGKKELIAKFKLASDADYFAWKMIQLEENYTITNVERFTVECEKSVISRYDLLRVEA